MQTKVRTMQRPQMKRMAVLLALCALYSVSSFTLRSGRYGIAARNSFSLRPMPTAACNDLRTVATDFIATATVSSSGNSSVFATVTGDPINLQIC